ncbi:PREDICTED: probable serine/threonine-protein kinase DDB_G0277165, partial [Rhagoletis zephyria]|uniref:probable serine/threonine-protein kinase DDB_G0277165 n=1 Tax=Rhagoletis zephyria TaxID=28612 RepID=UPI00081199A6
VLAPASALATATASAAASLAAPNASNGHNKRKSHRKHYNNNNHHRHTSRKNHRKNIAAVAVNSNVDSNNNNNNNLNNDYVAEPFVVETPPMNPPILSVVQEPYTQLPIPLVLNSREDKRPLYYTHGERRGGSGGARKRAGYDTQTYMNPLLTGELIFEK